MGCCVVVLIKLIVRVRHALIHKVMTLLYMFIHMLNRQRIYKNYLYLSVSPCHLVRSSRIRPLATAVAAPLHPALSLAFRLMLLMVAPLAYPLSVSSHFCLGLPLFLAPFILPSITSSSIPPALTTCPK